MKRNYSIWIKGRKTPIWNDYANSKEEAVKKFKKLNKGKEISKIAVWSRNKSKWVYLK